MPNTSAVYTIHDIGVAKQIGNYNDAVEVPTSGRLLLLSGTLGLTSDGHLPDTFEEPAEQAWENVLALLERRHGPSPPGKDVDVSG